MIILVEGDVYDFCSVSGDQSLYSLELFGQVFQLFCKDHHQL